MKAALALIPEEPATRTYFYLSLGALGAIGVIQFVQGVGVLNVLVVLVGGMGILNRLALTALLTTLLTGLCQISYHISEYGNWGWTNASSRWVFRPSLLLLSCAVLVFVSACLRLQSLRSNVVPVDPRVRTPTDKASTALQRSPNTVTPWEIAGYVVLVPICALLAQLGWYWILRVGLVADLPRNWLSFSKLLVVAWVLLGLVVVVWSLFSVWRWYMWTPPEAQVFLQDVLWRETRGEQRRVQRLQAWAHLQHTERKEPL